MQGANLDVQNNLGYTALMECADRGYTEAAKLIIAAGADINLQDNRGRTALFIAKSEGRLEIVKLLVAAGVQR